MIRTKTHPMCDDVGDMLDLRRLVGLVLGSNLIFPFHAKVKKSVFSREQIYIGSLTQSKAFQLPKLDCVPTWSNRTNCFTK